MTDAPETASPKIAEDGTALHGDYPLNHRLRAEALSKDGKAEDPDGMVTPDEIADAGKRLAAEKVSPDMPKAQLQQIAAQTPGASAEGTKAEIAASITEAKEG